MRGIFVLLGIAVLASAVAAIGLLVLGDASGAAVPGLVAATNGFVLYRFIKNPPQPKPLTKARLIASAVLGGVPTVAVIGMLAWTVVFVPDWSVRAAALLCIVFVLCAVTWTIRTMRRMDEHARTAGNA